MLNTKRIISSFLAISAATLVSAPSVAVAEPNQGEIISWNIFEAEHDVRCASSTNWLEMAVCYLDVSVEINLPTDAPETDESTDGE